MKGLVIKDFICLRKQISMFVMLLVMSVVIAIMFVLSARYGNLALAMNEMLESGDIDQLGIVNTASFAVMLFLFVPIAAVTDLGFIFKEDAKAGFENVAAILPLSIKQRVTARYITVFTILVAGVVVDSILCFVLSFFTDIMKFSESVNMIFAISALIASMSALLIFFCILLGKGKDEYAIVATTLVIVAIIAGVGFKRFKAFVTEGVDFISDMMTFIKTKAYMMVIVAVAITLICYLGSVVIAERKRGVL